MKPTILKLLIVLLMIGFSLQNQATVKKSESVYTQKFNDSEAFFFTPEKYNIQANGKLSDLKEILPRGETTTAVDKDGNLYVADGQIFVYDKNLIETGRINIPERPISMTFGGKDGNTLFVTTLTSLYGVKVK